MTDTGRARDASGGCIEERVPNTRIPPLKTVLDPWRINISFTFCRSPSMHCLGRLTLPAMMMLQARQCRRHHHRRSLSEDHVAVLFFAQSKHDLVMSCLHGEKTCTARLLFDYSRQLGVSKSSDSAIRYGRVRGRDPEPCSADGPEQCQFGSYRIYRSK